MKRRQCIDCLTDGITTARNAKYPGPRCSTHSRAIKKARRSDQWEVRIQTTYNITPEQYWEIYDVQGGVCAICNRANGKTRHLSVDHRHQHCKGSTSCGRCVSGLLCRTCNSLLGHLRDSPEAFQRGIDYLKNPPAKAVLGNYFE